MKAILKSLVVFVSLGSSLFADESRPRPTTKSAPMSLLERAQAKSETASTMSEYTEVIRLCEQAQKQQLSPNSAQFAAQLLAWARNRRGEAYAERSATYLSEGKNDQAKKLDVQAFNDFDAAVKADPSRWKAWHNRGVLVGSQGNWKMAIADFSRAIELNPDYPDARFNRAEIYYDRGRYDLAIEDYSQVIRLKPQDIAAYTGRGHAYFRMNKYREAHGDYHKTVELAGNDAHAFANRADAATKLGRWQEAAADYREALAIDPSLGRAYQGAAWLMATCPDESVRNPSMAIQVARKAIDLDGAEDAKYRDTMAAAYASAGKFNEARLEISRAIELSEEEQSEPLKVRRAMYEKQQPYLQAPVNANRPKTQKR